jgi:hypothetical protein
MATNHPNAEREIASDFFDDQDNWFLATLGALTAQWEAAEFYLSLFLCAITGIKHQHDLLQILNGFGPAQKVRTLRSLVDFHVWDKDQNEAARRILNLYDRLRKRRNTYIHALWMADPDAAKSSPQTFAAVSRFKHYSASRKHLRRLCEEIETLVDDIGEFYEASGNVMIVDFV